MARGMLGTVTLDEAQIAACIGLKPKNQDEQQPVVVRHGESRNHQSAVGSSSAVIKPMRARPGRLTQHHLLHC